MRIQPLIEIFERDLNKLKNEILLYPSEKSLWVLKEGVSNSGGNLCLHLIGNLNHFIGATIGHTGYVRQRDNEFSSKDIPRILLTKDIGNAIAMVKDALSKLTDAELEMEFPLELGGMKGTTGFILLHLLAHFNYHLGQINYHRRIIAS